MTSEVKQYVENCRECARESKPKREPLISTPLPDYPWQTVGADLFELKGQQYLVVVDYYSRYPECINRLHAKFAARACGTRLRNCSRAV